MRKKRILYLSDYAGAYTGFGKQTKLLLTYLYKTGKYEILNLAQGTRKDGPHQHKFPWKTAGVIPSDPSFNDRCSKDPNLPRAASYGMLEINSIVQGFKPDVIFAVNDTWGSQFVVDQPFASKIPCVFWNTFDSVPLLKDTIDKANKIKNYWTWSDFARKEFNTLGFNHVKNQYPLVNTDKFKKLSEEEINRIKSKHSIPEDSFIVGFVFRNQLRKLVNSQIEAFSLFKKNNPNIKNAYLYTHTHYSEGWDIPQLCKQYGVNPEEVLCTYVCSLTREYFILPFRGQNIENPRTRTKTLITSNAETGVTDEQLNEIYNIFSLYSHPATSGACELPCVEAALTEKIIATCPYSFGDDIISLNKGSIPMSFNFYTEHGTQFLKSQPFPQSIADIFLKVYSMTKEEKTSLEKLSREWAIENYSIETNGKKIENFIDDCPLLDFEKIDLTKSLINSPNPHAIVEQIPDNKQWVKNLYKFILDREVTDQDEGLLHWLQKISMNVTRQEIEQYFRQVANQECAKNNPVPFEKFLGETDKGKRGIFVIPGSKSDVLCAISLAESFKTVYPDYNLYIATKAENYDVIEGNPFVHKIIPYADQLNNQDWLEGTTENPGYFEIAFIFKPGEFHNYNNKLKANLNFQLC
jgi:glycosyltransferase involved in cell wall biosynthesis